MSEGPIILTGADRSGTTLLYALLASHSDVSMVRRTNMWRWFYGRYGDLAEPANLEECLSTMLRYPRLGVLEPDAGMIRTEFERRPQTYGQLFSVMHEQHAARRGRSRWGDKSLHTEHHADAIFSELPEARMLHMVRDPRDRYASIIRRYESEGKAAKGLGAAMGRWRASVRAGERNATRFGDERYAIVRYETLATSPESTLRTVCGFLDLPYEPQMLGMGGVSDAADYSGNSSFERIEPGEISTRSIGRFRRTLDAKAIALIEATAGRRLEAHGYERTAPTFAGADRIRFWAADLPLTGLRTFGWMADSKLGRGRKAGIPSHRLSNTGNGVNIS